MYFIIVYKLALPIKENQGYSLKPRDNKNIFASTASLFLKNKKFNIFIRVYTRALPDVIPVIAGVVVSGK